MVLIDHRQAVLYYKDKESLTVSTSVSSSGKWYKKGIENLEYLWSEGIEFY